MLRARVEKISANKRTTLLLLVASAMSIVLLYAGAWLSYIYSVKIGRNNPPYFITAYFFNFFLLLSLIAIGVGVFIGYFEQKQRWWLSGIALVPLFLLFLFDSVDMPENAFFIDYFPLSLLLGWIVSRSKKSVQAL